MSIEQVLLSVAAAVIAMWLGVLTFFGKRELRRLDGKADRAEVTNVLDRIDRVEDKCDTIMKATTQTQVDIARLVGRLEGRSQ